MHDPYYEPHRVAWPDPHEMSRGAPARWGGRAVGHAASPHLPCRGARTFMCGAPGVRRHAHSAHGGSTQMSVRAPPTPATTPPHPRPLRQALTTHATRLRAATVVDDAMVQCNTASDAARRRAPLRAICMRLARRWRRNHLQPGDYGKHRDHHHCMHCDRQHYRHRHRKCDYCGCGRGCDRAIGNGYND